MGELILMQLVELIENEFLYSDKELSVNSIIKDDFLFDEIDLVEILSRLEELLALKFNFIEIPEEIFKMSLLEFVAFLEQNIV
ncbi:MAG: hypothetical protein IJ356_10015 [Erysipelotrichaceae bacterium]|nr:hypothetical protein [Erysipelotrichaceae bacterium]